MPPVTRRASRASALGLAPLPRTTGLAAAAAAASASRGTPVNTEDCSICFSDLRVKRVVSLQNCTHHFHESCARRWAETRDCQHSQTCPVCRAPMSSVVDVSGNVMSLFPFGSIGEPTRARIMREMMPATVLQTLLQDTQTVLTRYENLERDESKGEEYSEDVQSEKDKMVARRDTLVDMQAQFDRGEWAEDDLDWLAPPWDGEGFPLLPPPPPLPPLPFLRPLAPRMQLQPIAMRHMIRFAVMPFDLDAELDEDLQPGQLQQQIDDANRRVENAIRQATRRLTAARRRLQQPTPPTRQSARIAARAMRGPDGEQQEQRQ